MSLPRDPKTNRFLPRKTTAPAAPAAPGTPATPSTTAKNDDGAGAPASPKTARAAAPAAPGKRWFETIICLPFLLCLIGCMSTVSIEDRNRGVMFRASVPVMPWQDSLRVIDRMNMSAKGSNFTASLRGLTDSETISTNAVDFFERGISAAVRAAIGRP